MFACQLTSKLAESQILIHSGLGLSQSAEREHTNFSRWSKKTRRKIWYFFYDNADLFHANKPAVRMDDVEVWLIKQEDAG